MIPTTPPNLFYIWRKPLDQQQSYYHFKGKYLCPVCGSFTEDFETFVNEHKQHAGAFSRPKPSYAAPPLPPPPPPPSTFCIWNKPIHIQKAYYSVNGKYLCPTCETLTDDFATFVEQHKNHAGAITRQKQTYSENLQQFNNQVSSTINR